MVKNIHLFKFTRAVFITGILNYSVLSVCLFCILKAQQYIFEIAIIIRILLYNKSL